MNYSALLVSAGIALSLAMPTQTFAATDDKAAAITATERIDMPDMKKEDY